MPLFGPVISQVSKRKLRANSEHPLPEVWRLGLVTPVSKTMLTLEPMMGKQLRMS